MCQIVRRETVGPLSVQVLGHRGGHSAVVRDEREPKLLVVEFLAVDFEQSMRKIDREMGLAEREYGCAR